MVGLYSPGYRIDCPAPFANMSITGFLWYQGENKFLFRFFSLSPDVRQVESDRQLRDAASPQPAV
eukprot:m.132491 g.132491  ORF g.132491 m.132491 type:complete len:65 (+) comp11335_c0_seq1:1686-1880(+)